MTELSKFQKIFVIIVTILSLICLGISLNIICNICSGNLLIESDIKGENVSKVDQETLSIYQKDRLMVSKANIYEYKTSRTEDNSGNYNIDSDVNIEGGGKTRSDRYEYRAKSKMGSQELMITDITDLTGESLGSIYVNDEGIVSYDSVLDINGNGKFYARAVDTRSGKPVTIDLFRGIGNLSIKKHFNITEEVKTPEDWLALCNTFSDDLIPNVGVKLEPIIPENYTINQTLYEIAMRKFANMTV
jgi:hypothetical protein